MLNLMENIRKVERKVRNLAAHQIIGVTAEWIEKRTGFAPLQIMNMMFELAAHAGVNISKKSRDIYQVMNQDLISML